MVALACPTCGASVSVPDDYVQRAEKCPRCGKPLAVSQENVPTLTKILPNPDEATVHHQPPATGVPENQAELCSFLAPAEGPGELGRLGGYRILRVLGAGAMGVVFEAEDLHLKRRVALKAMLPALAASATARQRFLREARAAAEVESDHVVAVYQVGEDRNVPFLAMQFLRGETLDERLQRGKLPLAEVLRIGREMALGLAAAHARGLVHRDIKPSNTWLEARDEGKGASAAGQVGPRVKILDFGLARGAGEDTNLTRPGMIVGTPSYMSPEQARSQPATARSDLFSLGIVLYRMATGTLPFKGDDTIATLLAVGTAEPAAPRTLNAAVPPALEALILRLLAKDPAVRPASAAEVADLLHRIETDGTFVLDAPVAPRPAPPRRAAQSRFVIISSLVILLGLGAFLATRIIGLPRAPTPGDEGGPSLPGTGSPLDSLLAANMPPEERVAGLETELVAVLGQREGAPVVQLAFSPDGSLLAYTGREGGGHVWDIAAGRQQAALPCRRIGFTPDGRSLVTVGTEGIGIWDLSGRMQWSIPRPKGQEIHAVDVGAGLLVWGGSKSTLGLKKKSARTEGTVRLWDLEKREEIAELPGPLQPIYAVKLSADGKLAAAMTSEREAHLWDVTTRKERKVQHARAAGVAAVLQPARTSPIAFSPDGKWLAIARRGAAYLIDTESGETQTTLREFGGFVHSVAFAPSSTRLVTVDARGVVILFDLAGKRLREWPMPSLSNDAIFAPDGRHLAVAGSNGTIYILRVPAATEH